MTLTLPDFASIALLWAALQFLASKWLEKRLESSIRHEYDRKLEEFRSDIRRREQAARVAKLLALRFRQPPISAAEFNELAWELSLWLPADLVRELTRCLCGAEGAKNPKEILIAVRKHILGKDDDGLLAEQIVHMEQKDGST